MSSTDSPKYFSEGTSFHVVDSNSEQHNHCGTRPNLTGDPFQGAPFNPFMPPSPNADEKAFPEMLESNMMPRNFSGPDNALSLPIPQYGPGQGLSDFSLMPMPLYSNQLSEFHQLYPIYNQSPAIYQLPTNNPDSSDLVVLRITHDGPLVAHNSSASYEVAMHLIATGFKLSPSDDYKQNHSEVC